MDGLDAVLAGQMRTALDERRLSREDFASRMRSLGFRWTGNRVTQVVTARRPMSLLEIAGVCSVLQVSVEELLLFADSKVDLPGGQVDVADVASALGGGDMWARKQATLAQMSAVFADHMDATVKAAKRLGVTTADVDAAARTLWGQTLAGERDKRVQPVEGETPRALQARRGHITRALLAELREQLGQTEAEA